MKPINNFRSALSLRDKTGMLAETAPHVEIMSAPKGTLQDRFSGLLYSPCSKRSYSRVRSGRFRRRSATLILDARDLFGMLQRSLLLRSMHASLRRAQPAFNDSAVSSRPPIRRPDNLHDVGIETARANREFAPCVAEERPSKITM